VTQVVIQRWTFLSQGGLREQLRWDSGCQPMWYHQSNGLGAQDAAYLSLGKLQNSHDKRQFYSLYDTVKQGPYARAS